MVCLHPHGVAGIGPLALLGQEPLRKGGKLENVFILAADVCFKVPFLREYFLFTNTRAANESVIQDVFSSGGSVAVFPGGIHEQLRTDPSQEKLSFPPNVGFVRQAIKHGVPLLPVYNFGENQQFGRWGLKLMPRFHPIQSRVGRPVEVGIADPEPSDVRVREVFLMYCAELRRLFDQFKDTALPSAVAARGLKLEWRGHEFEDLSAINVEGEIAGDAEHGPLAVQPRELTNVESRPLIESDGRELLHVATTRCVKTSRNIQLQSRM